MLSYDEAPALCVEVTQRETVQDEPWGAPATKPAVPLTEVCSLRHLSHSAKQTHHRTPSTQHRGCKTSWPEQLRMGHDVHLDTSLRIVG